MKILSTIVWLFIFSLSIHGQDNWSTFWTNSFHPALDTVDFKLKVSPANFLVDVTSSYKIDEITDELETTRLLNWGKLLGETKEKNGVFGQLAMNIISTELRVNDWTFFGGFGARSEANVDMDGPAVRFVIGGNAGGLDATTSIAPDINYTSWYQFYAGAQKHFERLTAGLNLKLVDGVEHLYFRGGYDISTSDIFDEIRINREVLIQSTSLFRFKGVEDIDFLTTLPFRDAIGFDNVGLLADLYASYKMGKNEFSVFVGDIGAINWSQEGRTYEYEALGETNYTGVDLSDAFGNEFIFNLQDTVENILGLEQTDTDSYSSSLLTKLQLRYIYSHDEKTSFGARTLFALSGEYNYFRVNLFMNQQLTKWLDASVIYSFDRYSEANLGLSARVKLKRFDLGISSQNVLALIDPYRYRLSNVQITTQLKI